MCLIKIEETARIATEPVKVYKILTLGNRSPFQYQEYHIGKNVPHINKDISASWGRTINGGYLHAYMNKFKAYTYIREMFPNVDDSSGRFFKVVEMYIPAGTEYWLGEGSEVAAECLYWPEDGNDNNINNK